MRTNFFPLLGVSAASYFCPGVTRIRTKLNPDRNVGGAIVMEGFAAALPPGCAV